MERELRLGVCPMGKFVFSHEDAVRLKGELTAKLREWGVPYVDLEGVLEDGMLRDQRHVDAVVEHFRGVDALFLPHCNFGTEGAAGMVAKRLGVPTLLWGPRDEAPLGDGSRLRDSLCGMFATSKVLRKLHVPFSYIENCRLDDPPLRDRLSTFLRAASVAKALRRMRIGQLGVRIDFFWTTIDNESELLERFGIEVLPLDMVVFLRDVKERARRAYGRYREELGAIKGWLNVEGIDEAPIVSSLAMRDQLEHIASDQGLDAFSIQSFSSLQEELGPGNALGDGLLQESIPVASESDIHGAVSSVLLRAASRSGGPVFFPEYTVRHPKNDNAVLLWHASAPPSLRHPSLHEVRFAPPWILKGLPPTSLQFRLRDGPLTVCRFDGDTAGYRLGFGQGKTTEGPATREFYVWMQVDDWPRWERIIMQGPYIHHCSAVYEHCADALEEACRYIPGLAAERYDRSSSLSPG
jgi:L-fucose isomerase-like protein